MTAGPCRRRNVERDGWRSDLTILCHCRVARRLDNRVMGGRVRGVLLLLVVVMLLLLGVVMLEVDLESFRGDKTLFEGDVTAAKLGRSV